MKFITQFKWARRLKIGVLALFACFAAAMTPLAAVSNEATSPAIDVGKKAELKEDSELLNKRKAIVKEARSALDETREAIEWLQAEDVEPALAALARATGKLEIILARDPALALAPSEIEAVTYRVLADEESIKKIRNAALKALKDGRLQESRRLLRDLASETVISVTSVPLATYPNAMKEAAAAIDRGELDAAQEILHTALNTLVVTDSVIPLPMANAQSFLADAEKLAEQKVRSVEESTRLTELIDSARRELQHGELLGYGTEGDYDRMYKQLDEIATKTADGKSGTGFFAKIKRYLGETTQNSQPDGTS